MYSEKELLLIQSVFAENDEPLYLIRKALLQFPMTMDERKQLKQIMTNEVYAVVRKRIFPELEPDSPLTQIGDIYQTLNNDLNSKGVTEMAPLFEAKEIERQYLEQQFEFLKDPEADTMALINLDDLKILKDKSDYQRYVDTKARNFLLGYIDPMINYLKVMAGTKKETLPEKKKRLTRDSSK